MARSGRLKTELILSDVEREQLLRWSSRAKSSQALALRSRMMLGCGEGLDNKAVAGRIGCSTNTVSKWRARFLESRLDGLVDEPRPGRPATITADRVEEVFVVTLETTPKNATHWSRAKLADRSGLSKSAIGRIWKAFELKPRREDGFKPSNDPQFVEKVYDVVGLYLNPPEAAVVYCVDEKSQVQALARSRPAFPMMPGMPERRTRDYVRHGTTSLFAAFNAADGAVISSIHRRRRATEFTQSSSTKSTLKSPTGWRFIWSAITTASTRVQRSSSLESHPRFHMHFTPTYSSWINEVKRFFAYVIADLLQRSDHPSVQALEAEVRKWIKDWNANPKPFIWTKSAEQILESLKRLLHRTTVAGH